MQRYQINYRWLIGVFATSFVLAVVAFFVWKWQVHRKAGFYLTQAESALAEDQIVEAFGSFRKYVQLRPKEEDVRIKMAEVAVKVAKDGDLPIEIRGQAFGILDRTVRTTDDPKLRRELAEFCISFRPQDAIEHFKHLLGTIPDDLRKNDLDINDVDPDDLELLGKLIRAYFAQKDYKQFKAVAFLFVGYDSKSDEFNEEVTASEDASDVYALLADVLTQEDDDEELARRVMDQMLLANPESPQSHLRMSVFLKGLKEFEALDSLEKAYALDPKDAGILSQKGLIALSGFLYNETKAQYETAITDYEEAIVKLTSREGGELEDPIYQEAKSRYEEAITGYEKSRPSYQEAKTDYQAAKSQFEEALSQIAPKGSAQQENAKYEKAQTKLADAKSKFEIALPDYEKARIYVAAGLQEHPDNYLFFRLMADVEKRLGQTDAALKILDEGISKYEKYRTIRVDRNPWINLVVYKIEVLFSEENFPAIENEIKRMARLDSPDVLPIVDYQRARVLFSKKEWAKAAREFKRIRPLLYNRPNDQVMSSMMLGACYESQGINDLALEAYDSVLTKFPEHGPAMAGMQRISNLLKPKEVGIELDRVVSDTLELPKAEQDWDKVDELVEGLIAERKLGSARAKLLRAKVLIKREKYGEAKNLIKEAAKEAPDDIDIQYTAILLVASDPQQGPAVALRLLDRLEKNKKWGVSLRSLAQRADLLLRTNPEDVSEQLRSLETKKPDLTEKERLQLYGVLGLKFEQLGKLDDAREFYEKSAALAPNNLPLRMHMFDLALRQQNDAAMQKAQAAVLEFVRSKNHPNYLLLEVKRRIASYARQEIDRVELAKARLLLDQALGDRPQWHELHIAYGQLLLLLEGDMELALQHFDEALESGPAKSNAVRIQVKLLYERGLYAKARERMELIHKEIRGRLLGQLEAEILIRTGSPEEGFATAKKLAAGQPTIPATQIWFSKIAQQTGKLDIAATALRGALLMNPSDPENWLRLIGLYAEQKKFTDVESVIREAHLASEAEFLPLLTGKYYELMSRWQNAESIYLATFADQLDRLSISRRLADFYLLWSAKDEANLNKAATYINRILRAANEGKAAADNPHVLWARQKAVQILFAKQDYQSSLKAERLLRQSAVNRELNSQESELLVDILISRKDPQSLMQAKQLLSKLRNQGRLPKKGALQLARIFSQSNQWEKAKSLLLELLGKYSEDPQVQSTYIELLIDQGEYSIVGNRINRLRELDPNNGSIVQFRARLASEQGNQAQVNQILAGLLPKSSDKMDADQLRKMLGIAHLANRYGAYELAGKIHKTHAKLAPDQAFEHARFLAYHGDCDQALVLMKRLYPDHPDDVIQLASRMISARRDEVGDKYDEVIDRLLTAALRDDPDSVSRILARAETYDTQGKHEESIAVYDQLLQRDDLSIRVRAAALNNLGFQLGLLKQRVDEAEQLINEAMETFGPVVDMLDTRAIVRIAQKKYDLAIEDMKLALTISQDPVQYFHLAKAYILAGDGLEAKKAWEKAQELGFEKKSLPSLERTDFEQILLQIESFQTQNAKL